MAEYIGMIKPQFVLALTEDEVELIIESLYGAGHEDLATEITELVYGACEDCDCGECA